jgi:hypothetical protein
VCSKLQLLLLIRRAHEACSEAFIVNGRVAIAGIGSLRTLIDMLAAFLDSSNHHSCWYNTPHHQTTQASTCSIMYMFTRAQMS